MKTRWVVTILLLAMMSGSAAFLHKLKNTQRLGKPGVKCHPIDSGIHVQVDLPERVLGYESMSVKTDETVVKTLPKDTSFGQRRYTAPDGMFVIAMSAVLQGTDRASIHTPRLCLPGQGFVIEKEDMASIPVNRPSRYLMPVTRFFLAYNAKIDGKPVQRKAIYLSWFVADNAVTGEYSQRQWLITKHMLLTGEMQRWAYLSCFAECAPGQEERAYERMKRFIGAAVPEFQIPDGSAVVGKIPPE